MAEELQESLLAHEEDEDFDRATAPEPEQPPVPKPAAKPATDDQPVETKPAEKQGAPVPPATGGGDELKELRRQLAERERRISEVEASERMWFDRANGKKPAPAAEEDPYANILPKSTVNESDYDTPAKLVDQLSTRGMAAFDELAQARGYLKRDDAIKLASAVAERVADTKISATRQQLTLEAQIQRDYGDLTDRNSELFKETEVALNELSAFDPAIRKSPAGLMAAAKIAKAAIASRTPASAKPDAAAQAEAERQARVRAQSSDRSARSARPDAEEDTQLSADARQVMGFLGVNAEDYKANRELLGRRKR